MIDLPGRAETYVRHLRLELPGRRVCTEGNRAATAFVAGVFSSFGFETQCPAFDCLGWSQQGADLLAGGERFEALVSPFSPGGAARAPLAVASAVEESEGVALSGRILLLRGEIAKEQLMPKYFPFYNPDEHRRIVRALEAARPPAIVAATSRDTGMAGALYPFPLIEDGDLDIPSVYITDLEGDRLAECAGREVWLEIRAERHPATGSNVIAHKAAAAARRAVFFAHVDAKEGTPGALDNAGGVAVLLLLAELLSGYERDLGVELVAISGKDYLSTAGGGRPFRHDLRPSL